MSGPPAPPAPPAPGPKVSVVLIVHDMAEQARRTVQSLRAPYQRGLAAGEAELVVVENRSGRQLDAAWLAGLPGVRHVLRDEPGVSPAAAINHGVALARAPFVGLMIDGARMLTPGVLALALAARRMEPDAVVAVPGYQLGPLPHHLAPGRTPLDDRALLDLVGWPRDGYRLFEVSSLSLANRAGWLRPFMECNCLFLPRDLLAEIGGADERFDLPGGGALNLWLWHRAVTHPRARLVVLPGEGSMHQVHGGVSTTPGPELEARFDRMLAQLNEVMGGPFAAPDVPPLLLGRVPAAAHPFAVHSAEMFARSELRREARREKRAADRQAERQAERQAGRQAGRRAILDGEAQVALPMGALARGAPPAPPSDPIHEDTP